MPSDLAEKQQKQVARRLRNGIGHATKPFPLDLYYNGTHQALNETHMRNPDFRLIDISTLGDTPQYAPVCVSTFERDGYQLYYVNAHHVTGTDNTTCQTIQMAMDLYRPKGVVVECGGDGAGARFDNYISYVMDRYKAPDSAANECDFTILLARQNGLAIANGEPTHQVIFRDLVTRGYAPQEIQAFFFMQRLCSSIKRREVDLPTLPAFLERGLQDQATKLSIARADRLSRAAYQEWFFHHYPERRDLLDIGPHDMAPETPGLGTFVQGLSYMIQHTREPHIIQTITDMLNRHQSVLVVYGRGHRETQKPVFEHMLGSCAMRRLAPEKPQPETGTNAPRPAARLD